MRAVGVIAAKDLRQRFRDRSALVLGFVAPLVVAGVMSLAFQGADDFSYTLAVADEDGGPLASAFLDVLASPELADIVTVEEVPSTAAAREAVDVGDVDAAVVVPDGFSAVTTGGSGVPVDVLTTVDATLAGQVTESITSSFVAQVNAGRLSVETALAAGAPPPSVSELAATAADVRLPEQVVDQPIGAEELELISYYAPGMAVFFVLFAVGFAARSFFGELREGTIDRMAVAPIGSGTILAGKAVSVVAYGLASLATMLVLTTLVFGADWGHPVAAALVCVAFVVAVVSLTALVIAVARTERQADSLSSIIVFGLALLGGSFIFVAGAPEVMRRLVLLTPNGWALRAFTDMATTPGGLGHDLETVLVPVLAILAFAAVVGAIAVVAWRRRADR